MCIRDSDNGRLGVRGLCRLPSVTQSPKQMPDPIAPQEVLLVMILTSRDGRGDEALETGHLLVARWERSGHNEHRPQVLNGFRAAELVEGGVGEPSLAACELTKDRSALVLGYEPLHGVGPFGVEEALKEDLQLGEDRPVIAAQQFADLSLETAAGTWAGSQLGAVPTARAALEEGRVRSGA